MKNSLIISSSDNFIKKDTEIKNVFVDRFTFDQCSKKKESDTFFEGRLDYDYRFRNYELSNKLFYEILENIKFEINRLFKKNFNLKFFEIIIGAWLRKFIQQFIFKYDNVHTISRKFKLNSIKIYDTKNYNFLTSETHTIQHATINNIWNACVYSYILENTSENTFFDFIELPEKKFNDEKFLHSSKSINTKKNLKNLIYNLISNTINFIPNNSNIFLYITGFNLLEEKKIDLNFFQFPRFYPNNIKFEYSNFDIDLRRKLNFKKFTKKNEAKLEKYNIIFNLIINILDKSLPLSILEDFENLIKFSEKINFPKNPKAICTSFGFEGDEPFKYYLALKKFHKPKVKYFVFQHGGSYVTRLDNNYNNECNTSDYFITWGEKTEITKTNNIKFVNFKLLNKKYFKKNELRRFVILTRSLGFNAVPYDRYSEGLNELKTTIELCKKFSEHIKKDTLIRAHYSAKKNKRLFSELKNFEIDYGEKNYFETISNSKLLLFNHDSTGMLEMIALNKPTLCFWGRSNHHQNIFVSKDYDLLRKAKVLHKDENELYDHIVKIWDDPMKWWFNEDVQRHIQKFVNLYTRLPDNKFATKFKNLIEDRL